RHVLDRSFVRGLFGKDGVLLEGVPAVVAACSQMPDDGRDVDVTGSQRPVHALSDGVGIGQSAGLHLCCNCRVDVLQVEVGDPVRRLTGEIGGIGTTDEQVTGVEAQRDRRAVENVLYFRALFDHRAYVRVQDGANTAAGR